MLFLAGTALLWWNEGRAVKTEKMLEEAAGAYVEMENPNKKDASLDGELVCGTAMATTEDSLTDAQFGIGAKAIAISRKVEYYQWVEHEHETKEDKLGGKEVITTTYTYSKEWVSSPIQSSQFKDPTYQNKNMVLTTFEDAEQYAENVSFGAYKLSESLIRYISSTEPMELAISEDLLKQFDKTTQTAYERFYGVVKKQPTQQQPAPQQPAAIPDSIRALLSDSAKAIVDSIKAVTDSIQAANQSLIANAENKKELEYVHQGANLLYFGRVPGSPEVGDVRVTFEKIVPAKVTVMAVVDGDSFKPYKAKNGKRFQTLVMGRRRDHRCREGSQQHVALVLPHHRCGDGHRWSEGYLRLHRDHPEGGAFRSQYRWLGYRCRLHGDWCGMVADYHCPRLAVLPSCARHQSAGHCRLPGMGVRLQGQGQAEGPGLEIQSAQSGK